ncbi:exported protein of unknown function [Methanocaldococcus lauensis]|nr:exported protein of unknown function [Methanocaldococcus lauensis]
MMKKFVALFAILILSLSLSISFCGCSEKTSQETAQNTTIKITDMLGREVVVPKDVNRIVCIGPGCLRLIVYLNATDKVVGVEDAEKKWSIYGRPYRIAHPELAKLPTIGQGGPNPKPNPEEIIKVKPDVIFACYITKEQADDLQKKTGIPVVILSYGKLATFNNEDIFKSLRIAGKILDKEDRAEEVIKFIKDCENDLNNRTKDIPDNKKPTVYVGGIGFKGMHGIDSTQCKYPPFEAVNAKTNELSGGELQKVIIARALVQEPQILLLDEPTNNLDLKNQLEVMKIIRDISKSQNITSIVVMHDLNLALRYSDKFIMLKDGKIFAEGDRSIINPENIRAVYGVNAFVENIRGIPVGSSSRCLK